jgi:copper chaperone CopZ
MPSTYQPQTTRSGSKLPSPATFTEAPSAHHCASPPPHNLPLPLVPHVPLTAMAHLQLAALAGGDAEMEGVALLGGYDEEAGPADAGEAGMRRVQVRVTGMTCSACSGAVEAALSARRGVRRADVSLLQNRAHVVFDSALAKVRGSRDPSSSSPPVLRAAVLEFLRFRNSVDPRCCFGRVLWNCGA